MQGLLYSITSAVAYCIYPTVCAGCPTLLHADALLCRMCWGKVKPVVSIRLPISTTKIVPVYAACAYDEPIKSLVTGKFHANIAASKKLAQVIVQMLSSDVFAVDYIIPVPLHWMRYAGRGYNQAVEMARFIAADKKIPVLHALRRVRHTKYQWYFSRKNRQINVLDAFVLKKGFAAQLQGKRILLIDDLCTTGATISAVARVLYAANIASVSAAVACRPV